jgi:ligand-binding SRPBCC domain-containing protein
MKIYQIKRTQVLPITLGHAWDFFSSPRNLARITPGHMRFQILGFSGSEKMYAGQIIRYKIFILPFVPLRWTTEITHVDSPHFFVDVQRFGPFAMWHHQHSFREVQGGVEMTDEVNYAIPFGVLGRFTHWIFVRSQVNSIFDYRFRILQTLFSTPVHNIKKSA